MSSASTLTELRGRVQSMRAPSLPNSSGQGSADFGTSVRTYLLQLIDCLRLQTTIWGNATLPASTNNLAIPAPGGIQPNTIRLSNTAGGAIDLTGLVAPTDTQVGYFYLLNITSDTISLKSENAGSTSGNRFLTPGGADVALGLNAPVKVAYDPDALRWRVLGI